MNSKTYPTNFKAAVEWLNGNLIRFNNILNFDSDLYYRNVPRNEDGEECYEEIYEWYLTDFTDDDVDFLIEHFNLNFAYSEKFNLWILLVTKYGTSWDYVYWTTDIENASCGLGENPKAF